jgi:hypothetical protein
LCEKEADVGYFFGVGDVDVIDAVLLLEGGYGSSAGNDKCEW